MDKGQNRDGGKESSKHYPPPLPQLFLAEIDIVFALKIETNFVSFKPPPTFDLFPKLMPSYFLYKVKYIYNEFTHHD